MTWEQMPIEKQQVASLPADTTLVDIQYPWIIRARYLLKKNSQYNFEILIRIKFYNSFGIHSKKLQNRYTNKLRSCLNTYQDRMFNYANRDTFKITLAESSNTHAPLHKIRLKHDGFRSNYSNWQKSIDCTTMLHEVFHIFGLADEYFERDTMTATMLSLKKNVHRYSCRHVTTRNSSIMNHQDNRIHDYGEYTFLIYRIAPQLWNSQKKILQKARSFEELAFIPFKQFSQHLAPGFFEYAKILYNDKKDVSNILQAQTAIKGCEQMNKTPIFINYFTVDGPEDVRVLCRFEEGPRKDKALLQPGQVNLILHPREENLSSTYRACSVNAYRTRHVKNDDCFDVPEICNTRNWNKVID